MPGDKSISHRSHFAGPAVGETRISGLLEGADVLATKDALIAQNEIEKTKNGDWQVIGVGLNGTLSPKPLILATQAPGSDC